MQSDDLGLVAPNGLIEALKPYGIDVVDLDMLRRGDKLDKAGAKFYAAIERLVAERDRLAEALTPFRLLANCTDSEPDGASVIVNVNRARDARTALKDAP